MEVKAMKWGNTSSYLFSQGRFLQWNVSILMSNSVCLILSITKETPCLHQGVSFARSFALQIQSSKAFTCISKYLSRFHGTSVEAQSFFFFTHQRNALLNLAQSTECLADPSPGFVTLYVLNWSSGIESSRTQQIMPQKVARKKIQ